MLFEKLKYIANATALNSLLSNVDCGYQSHKMEKLDDVTIATLRGMLQGLLLCCAGVIINVANPA